MSTNTLPKLIKAKFFFKSKKKAKELVLTRKWIGKMEGLEVLPNLEVLNLSSNSNIAVMEGLHNLPCLRTLDLSYNAIKRIQDLKFCVNLRDLRLVGNQIKVIEGLGKLANLTALDLGYNGISKIQGLTGLKNLKHLSLHCQMNGVLKKLEGFYGLTKLRSMYLRKNGITVLENLDCLESLQNLDISENKISVLEGFENLPSLRKCTLSKNPIKSIRNASYYKQCKIKFDYDMQVKIKNDRLEEEVFGKKKKVEIFKKKKMGKRRVKRSNSIGKNASKKRTQRGRRNSFSKIPVSRKREKIAHGVGCNYCSKAIVGTRYNLIKRNLRYNLCNECFLKRRKFGKLYGCTYAVSYQKNVIADFCTPPYHKGYILEEPPKAEKYQCSPDFVIPLKQEIVKRVSKTKVVSTQSNQKVKPLKRRKRSSSIGNDQVKKSIGKKRVGDIVLNDYVAQRKHMRSFIKKQRAERKKLGTPKFETFVPLVDQKKIFWDRFEKTGLEVKKCFEFYSFLDGNFTKNLETGTLNLSKTLSNPIGENISTDRNDLSLYHVYFDTSVLLKKIKEVFSTLTPTINSFNQNSSQRLLFFEVLSLLVKKIRDFFKGVEIKEEGFAETDFETMYALLQKCLSSSISDQPSIKGFLMYYQEIIKTIKKSEKAFLEFNQIKTKLLSLKENEERRSSLLRTTDKKEFEEYVSLTIDQSDLVSKGNSLFPKIQALEQTFHLSILGEAFKVGSIHKEMQQLQKMMDNMDQFEKSLVNLKRTTMRYHEKTRKANTKTVSRLIKIQNEIDKCSFLFYKIKIGELLKGVDLVSLQKAMNVATNTGIVDILKKTKQKIMLEKIDTKFGSMEVFACWETDGLVYSIKEQKDRTTDKDVEITPKKVRSSFNIENSSLLEIPEDRIEYFEVNGKKVVLGIGGFGEVRKIKLLSFPERTCAIKVIKFDGSLKLIEDAIRKEVFMVKYLSHPGIVSVFGYVRFSDYKIGIVMECMDGGNLFSVVNKNKGKLSNFEKYYLSKRMIDVLLYLHEEKGIIHRDIKPQNWLCSIDRKIIKLSDFGLIKIKTSSSTTGGGGVKGTFRYIANELYEDEYTYSFASDIFALGMTLYYLFVEEEPFYEIKNSPMAAMKIMLKLNKGGTPSFPENIPKEFVKIIKWCIGDVKKRPSAKKLLEYVCSVEKGVVKVNPPSEVVPIKERKCQFCFKTRYCYLSECCSKFFCEVCILKKIEKKNSIEVKCFGRCKVKFSREWIHKTKNAKLTEKLFFLDLQKKYNKCGNCGNLIDIVQTEENKMVCQRCEETICRFCFIKWKGKNGLCSNEECELFDDPLESLNVRPEMIPFKFTGEKEPRSIFRARLCPWCGNPIFRVIKSTDCKHMECTCGNSFCFVCLGKKKGKMYDETEDTWKDVDGGDPWGYCGLAVKQTDVPKSLK